MNIDERLPWKRCALRRTRRRIYPSYVNSSLNHSGGSAGGSGGSGSGGGGRLIVPVGRALSAEETAVANQLVAESHTVEALAESSVRTADFLVDGVRTG